MAELLSAQQIVDSGLLERYRVGRRWLYRQVKAGTMPCLRVHDRLFLFDPEKVKETLESRWTDAEANVS